MITDNTKLSDVKKKCHTTVQVNLDSKQAETTEKQVEEALATMIEEDDDEDWAIRISQMT